MARSDDYIGKTDAQVLAFCSNFGTIITGAPLVYNLTVQDCTNYQSKVSDFDVKLQAATNPTTRGKRTIFEKQEAKKVLVALTRQYAQQINKMVTITNDQRLALGITIASDERHPVPQPDTEPFIKIVNSLGRRVTIELCQSANKRGRPPQTAAATVVAYIGDELPQSFLEWKFMLNTSKTTVELDFGASETAQTVWISAFWTNSRSQSGPAALPISIHLPASGAMPTNTMAMPDLKAA